MPDKIKAILPMTKAFNEIKARNPMASGKRAAAFNLNNRRSGNKYFFPFLPLRAVMWERKKEILLRNCRQTKLIIIIEECAHESHVGQKVQINV